MCSCLRQRCVVHYTYTMFVLKVVKFEMCVTYVLTPKLRSSLYFKKKIK
jgi:hypothetical protein